MIVERSSVLLVGKAAGRLLPALAELGTRVAVVRSSQEALATVGEQELALISYPEPVRLLRAHAPRVALVAVDAPASEIERLFAEGATDVMPAPLDLALLGAKIGALLGLLRNLGSARAEAALLLAEAERARTRAESAQRNAEDAVRLKDQFLATLSHEMRTPLTSILGWVRLLRLGKASAEPAGRALESIERNARLQAQLVADLLDVQRIAAGKMSVTFRELDLGALLDGVLQQAQPAAAEAGVELQDMRSGDEELRIFGDSERLHQALSSLISNAIKFSPRGTKVRVGMQPTSSEALIMIRDEGSGIDPSFLPHAFDQFRQEKGELNREKGGLGLGLSIVRHLVELHGGTVTAESEGQGTSARFTVSLPLRSRVARPDAARSRSAPEPKVQQSLQSARILVVEDDLDTQYLLATALEHFGARVTCAGSAAEAITALSEGRFELILSDISMPGEDGYSMMRRIRTGGVQAKIPAAALTANARSEDRTRALAAGFHTHIPKPVEPLELEQILARLLSSAAK